jgi:protein-S-isoprenylcysteine O-methyltransferase Ste14
MEYTHKNLNHFRSHVIFVYIATLLGGVVIDIVFPIRFLPLTLSHILGVVFLVLATLLLYWATTHHRHVTKKIVQGVTVTHEDFKSGPFSISRNPTYLSLTFLILSFGVLLDSLVIVLAALVAFWITHVYLVQHEEKFLEELHPESFAKYKENVRRWL